MVPEPSVSSWVKSAGVSLIGDCCMRSAETAARREEVAAARILVRAANDPALGCMKALATEKEPRTRSSERANILCDLRCAGKLYLSSSTGRPDGATRGYKGA
jgi:hypothetical protein